MRNIGAVTVGRSDYGIYESVFSKIEADPDLELSVFVSGTHLSPEFGLTGSSIRSDGYRISAEVEMLLSSDSPEGISKSIGMGIIGFAQAFARDRPDILLVLGDRFEMYAAAVAALPFNIPVAHIHGGEVTEGAIDDAFRHSMTKLSHLHFVTTEDYGKRVRQLGEEAWRIVVSGAPSLDNLNNFTMFSHSEMESAHGFSLSYAPLLVTFHPVTLEYQDSATQIKELIAALEYADMSVVFTGSNADTNGRVIVQVIQEFVDRSSRAWFCENLGSRAYYSLMASSAAMVGNSSSGIIEAASVGLPVVNIGSRQNGRIRSGNVIDVGYSKTEIVKGIEKATAPSFRLGLNGLVNPYGDGHASDRIIDKLKCVEIDRPLINKKFQNLT